MLTYFQILQVEENATQDEIKKSYRKLCKILHPDMHGNTPEANIIFRLLHESYETLSDPTKRRNYNPKNHSSTFDGVSYSDYDEMITSYKNIVADYENILQMKNRREKELLNKISQLKRASKQNRDSYEMNANVNKIKTESQDKESVTIKIIALALVISVAIALLILFFVYPVIMTFFLVLGLIIRWVYKLFK